MVQVNLSLRYKGVWEIGGTVPIFFFTSTLEESECLVLHYGHLTHVTH